MITEGTIEIEAPATTVWEVFSCVEDWPEMTASVNRLTPLDGAELAVGRRYRIEQPKFPKLVWTVTELTPGRSWTWKQRSPGGTTFATHEVTPLDAGRTHVRQVIDQRGPIGWIVAKLTKKLTLRYLDQEAQGLKARAEQVHATRAATA